MHKHEWQTVSVELNEHTDEEAKAIERCLLCGNLRVDESVEVVEVVEPGLNEREA